MEREEFDLIDELNEIGDSYPSIMDEGDVAVPIPEETLEELRVRAREFYKWYQNNFPFYQSITFNSKGVTVESKSEFVPRAYLLKD